MKALIPFIKLFKQQWLFMSLGLLLTMTTIIAGIGLLSLSGWFLSAAAVAGLTAATALAFNFFTPAGGVRFLSIARTASRYGERLVTHEATFRLLTNLRVWVWQKLLPLSAKNLQGVRRGDLLNRLVADIDTLDHLYLRLLVPMTGSLLVLGLLYLFLAMFDASLAKVLCGILLAMWLLIPALFYLLGREPGVAQVQTKANYRVTLLEYLQGQSELTLFGANQRYRQQLDDSEMALHRAQIAMANVSALSQACLVLMSGIAVIVMLYLSAQGVGSHVPPGPLMALMVFATMACIEMMMPLAGAFQHLSACVMAANRLTQVTEQQSDIVFNPQATASLTDVSISFKQVSFGYDAQVPVLQNLDLHIVAGSKVAILGKTGSGKSSLLSLLTREWQPQQGKFV